MSEFGITAFGAYVPRMRLERSAIAQAHKWMAPSLKGLGKGHRAFCNWDEDTVTMAVEAGRDALAGRDVAALKALGFASTNAPFADLQASAIVAGALDLPDHLRASDHALGQRAGTSGLLAALAARQPALFIASDAPPARPASTQEMTYGAGAAAFVLGSANVAARLLGAGSVTANFVDHFRDADNEHDYHWEERWVRDEGYGRLVPRAVEAALADAGLEIGDIDHFAMASMLRGAAANAAKRLGFAGTMTDELGENCGYAGAAHAPLMLARALEEAAPGEKIIAISFGQGVDALIFEATDGIAAARPARGVAGSVEDGIVTDSYLRMLSFAGGIDLEWGMRSERNAKTALSEQYRSGHQIDAFMAGRCGECGTIQFPQLQYCVNCHAPAERFSDVSLRDEPARVMTQTADWLSYYPSPPLNVGFVQFANGARVLMEMVEFGPEGVDIGAPVKMVYRIKERDQQRGYRRYFWKATRAAGEREG